MSTVGLARMAATTLGFMRVASRPPDFEGSLNKRNLIGKMVTSIIAPRLGGLDSIRFGLGA